jgi:hypothetical protein
MRRGLFSSEPNSDFEIGIRHVYVVACSLFALFANLLAQECLSTPSAPLYRSDVDLLSVAARVTDHNDNAVRGLSARQFKLCEDGVLQKVSFFAEEDESISLGILLDVSTAWVLPENSSTPKQN